MTTAEYDPGRFNARDIEAAKAIILTPESGETTDERWERETPYLADLIERSLDLSANCVLLDFGCGIGRLSKEMIARTGCRVVGVDISQDQRCLAPSYVRSDRFLSCSPDSLVWMIESGLRFDGAVAVWVLQHCLRPEIDAKLIARALRPGASLFVANEKGRCVPAIIPGEGGSPSSGWIADGKDVRAALRESLDEGEIGAFDQSAMRADHAETCFWAVYGKPA